MHHNLKKNNIRHNHKLYFNDKIVRAKNQPHPLLPMTKSFDRH